MRVSSSSAAAREAVSGFTGVRSDSRGEHVSVASSTVSSVREGARAANELLAHVSELVAGVKGHAGKVTTLAARIEARDSTDAGSWGGAS